MSWRKRKCVWQVTQERTPHLSMVDRIPYSGCFLSYNLQARSRPLILPSRKETHMRKRPIELKFRLSEDEYVLLQKNLAETGMSRNAYLVRLITGAQIYPKDQLIQLNLEYSIMNRLIRGIGTNINQLAKISNTNRQAPSAKLLADMSQDVRVMKSNLDDLWEETRKNLWQS